MSIVLHQESRQAIDTVLAYAPHAVLITGPRGSGKAHIAQYVAATMLDTTKPHEHPYFMHLIGGTSLGIEQVRAIQSFLQLKTIGDRPIRRVIIIESAESLTTEAQNALLKSLEEPPKDTMILLTSSEPHVLKSTIHSRVQGITVVNPDKQAIEQHFTNSGHKSIDVEKAYQLSGGYIGLMHALLDTETSHPLAESIQVAKRWYAAGSFERLTMIEDIAKQRDDLAQFIFACKRICSSALAAAAKTGDVTKVTQWHKQLSVVVGVENSLRYTPNAKLLLTDLCMSM